MSLSDPPPTQQERLRSLMNGLRQRFRARAAEDFAAIQGALTQQDFLTLRDRAHQLAGTAGSFGFPHVGDAARVLEDSVKLQASDVEIYEAACNLLALLDQIGSDE